MLTKDHHCLESIIEAIDRIIEYTSGFDSADDFNNDYRNFDATIDAEEVWQIIKNKIPNLKVEIQTLL